MGVNHHNVYAYYHGNNGERGLEVRIHAPFDAQEIATLTAIVEKDDLLGFGRWLKANYPKIFDVVGNSSGPCLKGTFQTLKESGVLSIQQERMPKEARSAGPRFPAEWDEESLRVYRQVKAEP